MYSILTPPNDRDPTQRLFSAAILERYEGWLFRTCFSQTAQADGIGATMYELGWESLAVGRENWGAAFATSLQQAFEREYHARQRASLSPKRIVIDYQLVFKRSEVRSSALTATSTP